MARQIELSESEIVQALRDARRVDQPDPPGAFIVSEMAKKTGQSPRTVRQQITALREKGLIETVKVHRRGSDGRYIQVTAYVILKAPKARR